MTELKTLKDIKLSGTTIDIANNYEDIKQIAITWVKHWNVYNKELSPPPKNPMDEGGYAMMCGATGAFMNFFNITEEDLA